MILSMKDICKDYPMGKSMLRVLKNVNLQVEEGEYLAIMGPSGSGKTTLMNILGLLDTPTSGEYLLEGRSHPYIRDELFISKSTVDTHVRHIYSKTGVKSKQELIDLSKRLAI